jgi:competence protein ComGC
VEDAGRTTLQTLVEGLIVLAVIVVGVLILVALLD